MAAMHLVLQMPYVFFTMLNSCSGVTNHVKEGCCPALVAVSCYLLCAVHSSTVYTYSYALPPPSPALLEGSNAPNMTESHRTQVLSSKQKSEMCVLFLFMCLQYTAILRSITGWKCYKKQCSSLSPLDTFTHVLQFHL